MPYGGFTSKKITKLLHLGENHFVPSPILKEDNYPMRIIGTATAYPPHRFSQQEIVEALKDFWGENFDKSSLLERLHNRTGVDNRYFSRPLDEYRALDTWGKANDVWIEVAEELGERAIDCALKCAGLTRERINAIFFVSVTGVGSPSIDARLVNRMGLSTNIQPHSNIRPRMCRWCSWLGACRRLCACLSGSSRCAACGRVMFTNAASEKIFR